MIQDRGIILTPDIDVNVGYNSFFLRSKEPNPNILRHAILYWDKIAFPQNNLVRVQSRDIDFLEQEGIAQQPKITMSQSGEFASLYVQGQINALDLLNKKNPGMWTMGQFSKDLIVTPENAMQDEIIEIEINNVLPIPPYDIPLADILELKQKRADEFKALRIAVDELYDEALRWGNVQRGKNAAIQRLQESIDDIRKIVHASWLKRRSTIKFAFILETIMSTVGGFLLGENFAEYLGMPCSSYFGAAGAIAGMACKAIKFEKKFGATLSDSLPERSRNFAALLSVEDFFPGTIK